MDFFDGPERLVVAHRGFAEDVPENTLPAFRAALDVGADILETDVHVSADGVAMVCHDPDLTRVAGRPGVVAGLSRTKLQSIDLGGAHMPTLDELLEEFPHARFSVDLKVRSAIGPTVATIRAHKAEKRILIASFDHGRRRKAHQALTGTRLAGGARETVRAYLAHRFGAAALARRGLRGVDALFLPENAYGVDFTHPAFIDSVSKLGVQVGFWTINEPDLMSQLWSHGARAIITDRTDLAVSLRAAA